MTAFYAYANGLADLQTLRPGVRIVGVDTAAGTILVSILHKSAGAFGVPQGLANEVISRAQDARSRAAMAKSAELSRGKDFGILFGWQHREEVRLWCEAREINYADVVPNSVAELADQFGQ